MLRHQLAPNGAIKESAEENTSNCMPLLLSEMFDLDYLLQYYRIGILPPDGHRGSQWVAFFYERTQHDIALDDSMRDAQFAKTPIKAVMRCIIYSYIGDEVEVPDELM